MVNPLDFIPKLSGFSPMPLGIMAPFMGYQSAALAYNFGLNYEFGKRVIKSMSNEKFNKIAEDPILLNELTSRHHDVLLQAFINEVPKVDKIQDLIIKKMVELEFAKIKVMPELIAQIPKGFIEGIFSLGGGTNDNENAPTAPPKSVKIGKSGTTTPKPINPAIKIATLPNFSTLNISLQRFFLARISGVYSHIQEMQKAGNSRSRAYKEHHSHTMEQIRLWKEQFISIGGYQPLPEKFKFLFGFNNLMMGWDKLI